MVRDVRGRQRRAMRAYGRVAPKSPRFTRDRAIVKSIYTFLYIYTEALYTVHVQYGTRTRSVYARRARGAKYNHIAPSFRRAVVADTV